MAELTLAVAMIPNDDRPWDSDEKTIGWNSIGMSIHAASGGSDEGLNLFRAFSKRSSKYNEERTRKKWNVAFRRCPPDRITAGTIFFLAEQAVPEWKSRILADDPEVIALLEEFHKLLGEP